MSLAIVVPVMKKCSRCNRKLVGVLSYILENEHFEPQSHGGLVQIIFLFQLYNSILGEPTVHIQGGVSFQSCFLIKKFDPTSCLRLLLVVG